ncbi:MAG: hypothetical protein SGI83_05715 [Bacteroidota bacterium]|nr:hypothetical protein [Bacteroidota bacterium]
MKKIILVAVWQLALIVAHGQTTTPASSVTTDYLKKSRNQKTTAWILLSGGTTLVMVGMAVGLNEVLTDIGNIGSNQPEKSSNVGEVLFYTGLASIAGSIPLFIASSKNKKKANNVSVFFKIQQQPTVSQGIIIRTPYPVLAVKIGI